MKRNLFLGIFLVVALMLVSCNDDDYKHVAPAYLHLDKIDVIHNSDGTTSTWGDSWLTSKIDAVQIELWFKGEDATTTLGTFELPCTVPVLTDKREIEKIQISPFVKQNGIAATHIYYPYYEIYVGHNIEIAPDSITNIGVQDKDSLWSISVPYRGSKYMDVLLHEFFEPQQMSIVLDSMAERVTNEDACSGLGFGRVEFKASEDNKTFFADKILTEHDASSYLYLEMDYRTDARLAIGMESSATIGGNPSILSVITLYPTDDEWNKIYINLGRTWKYFNYNPHFKICFTILNKDKIDGNVDIDNLKVLSL